MSTNPDQQDFQDLRRLLALKRHEQPPPGYFNFFSREVIMRIRAGERAPDQAFERWFVSSWLLRFWSALETKPALAGAVGACLCAMMLWAVVSTENAGSSSAVIAGEPFSGHFDMPRASQSNPLMSGMMVSFSSTNGVAADSHGALFQNGWPGTSFPKFPGN